MMTKPRAILLLTLACTAAAPAPAPDAESKQSVRPRVPVLEELSRESQLVYTETRRGVARVQLPPPKWINELAAKDNPLDKWGDVIGGQLKVRLEQEREAARAGNYVPVQVDVTASSTTQPAATQPTRVQTSWRFKQIENGNTVVLEPAPDANGAPQAIEIHAGGERDARGLINPGGAPQLRVQAVDAFAPNNVGLVFDAAGHVLVPLYVEKETIAAGVPISVGDGPVEQATFVASDRQTNLTVLKLPESQAGKREPVRLAEARPAEGAMVMLLAPNNGSAQWVVWNESQQNLAGVVVAVDGSVAGFERFGQFLSASSCKPVVEQLVQFGRVKRAKLGVIVRQVDRTDPARDRVAGLGSQPALRVEQVFPNSAAERAGLKRGDLILSVASQPVGDPPALGAAIADRKGDTPLRVLRDGETVDVSVKLNPEDHP